MNEIRETLLRNIAAERTRQDTKFGAAAERGYSAAMWLSVLVEEVGEAAKEVNDAAVGQALLHELVQVAAVAVAFAEATIANIETILPSPPRDAGAVPPDRWGRNGESCCVWGRAIVLGDSNEQKEERARLIAAAPDLLAALERCVGALRTVSPGGDGDPDVEAALAAIAKAKGTA